MIAFYKGADPREVAEIQKRRPSAWTLFKEGLAKGAGEAIVEAPVRFGTDIAVDYVAPTRRAERAHMGVEEEQGAQRLAETERSNKATEAAREAEAARLTAEAERNREANRETSRRAAQSGIVRPGIAEVPMGEAQGMEEVPVPELAPPRPLSRAVGAQDEVGATEAPRHRGPESILPRGRGGFARFLRREGEAAPEVPEEAPVLRSDKTGKIMIRGRYAPEGPLEESPVTSPTLAGYPGYAEVRMETERSTAEQKRSAAGALERKGRGGGKGGPGAKPLIYPVGEINATADQNPELAAAMVLANEMNRASGGRTTANEIMGRKGAKRTVPTWVGGEAPAPKLGPSKAEARKETIDFRKKAHRDKMALTLEKMEASADTDKKRLQLGAAKETLRDWDARPDDQEAAREIVRRYMGVQTE